MSDISFGKRYSRGFQKFYDGFHLVAGVVCVLLLLASMVSRENPMKFFPLIFLDAAALNLVTAYARIKTSYRRRYQRSSGFGFLLLGIIMLLLTVATGICVW
ncbi:MAG: hypothetical protein IJ315_06520 [Firmicutes bacterium]|nr:hypothetical protein [Bacillota bacterium]